MGITGPILLGQYMIPRFLMCPMSTNILTILANFPDTIIPFLPKTSVMTMTTLIWNVRQEGSLMFLVGRVSTSVSEGQAHTE